MRAREAILVGELPRGTSCDVHRSRQTYSDRGQTVPASYSTALARTGEHPGVHQYTRGQRLNHLLIGAGQLRIARRGSLIETSTSRHPYVPRIVGKGQLPVSNELDVLTRPCVDSADLYLYQQHGIVGVLR